MREISFWNKELAAKFVVTSTKRFVIKNQKTWADPGKFFLSANYNFLAIAAKLFL